MSMSDAAIPPAFSERASSEVVSESVKYKNGDKRNAAFDKTPICQGEPSDCYDASFWGPYLSERQWGTVREDYSSDDSCWSHTTYDSSLKNAYTLGEDGLLGVSDKHGLLCASVALWNEQDDTLKEKMFGLSGKEGNHGEDVKELYYYLDNMPDHHYMHALYKYPQAAFPYHALRNSSRTVEDAEFEIAHTGVFDQNCYWDFHVEYAKPSNPHLICKYTAVNKSSENAASLHIIPQFYFRNTWSKPSPLNPNNTRVLPAFTESEDNSIDATYEAGSFHITFHHSEDVTFNELLFTNNDSVENDEEDGDNRDNNALDQANNSNNGPAVRLSSKHGTSKKSLSADSRASTYPRQTLRPSRIEKIVEINPGIVRKKDAFHRYIVHDKKYVLTDVKSGTKVGAWMTCDVPPQGEVSFFWQIIPADVKMKKFKDLKCLDAAVQLQKTKADEFYQQVIPKGIHEDQANLCRQALAGLLWSKQFYLYHGEDKVSELYKLHGEEYFYEVQGARKFQWKHLDCEDILLVPDKWEFPWFAPWDLAFQAALYAPLDLAFAKRQITTILSDRYMHPNGQIPGCEFNFNDTNPPLLAWAVWKIHEHEKPWHLDFIKLVYPRLLINYQWWHRLDLTNSHLFGNGFMGLDNISVIDRSNLPRGISGLKQADATGWMALFALNMLQLTLRQCQYDLCLTDMAIRFLSDFLSIAKAINMTTDHGGLWHTDDNFYYDLAHFGRHHDVPVRVRSWTGLIPLFACAKINLTHAPAVKEYLKGCDKALAPYVCKLSNDDFFFTLVPYIKLKSVLYRAFAEKEFLSPYGIRSISKLYNTIPLNFDVKGHNFTMTYLAGESDTEMFGGNSNWRGPIWLCLNYLFVECLERYSELNQIFTNPLSMDYPSALPLSQRKPFVSIVEDLCERILNIFALDGDSARRVHGTQDVYLEDDWIHLIQFFEYYHSESGRGCGASHQTGWSALYVEFVKKLHQIRMNRKSRK